MPLLLAGVLVGERPIRSLIIALGGAGLVLALDSTEVLAINASALHDAGLALPFGLTVLGVGVVALVLRRPWRRLAPDKRQRLALAGLALATVLVGVLVPLALGQALSDRYLFMVPPALALSLALYADAWLAGRSFPWGPITASLGLALLLLAALVADRRSAHGGPYSAWRLPDIELLAAELSAQGIGYAEAYRRLQGPGRDRIIASLASLEPGPRPGTPDRGTPGSLLVLRAERDTLPEALPDTWRAIDLDRSSVALLRAMPGGLQSHGHARCTPKDAAPCKTFDRIWREQPAPRGRFQDRAYIGSLLYEDCRPSREGQIEWRLPIDTSSGPVRVVLARKHWAGCTWQIDGAPGAIEIPQHVETQLIHLTATLGGSCSDRCAPPPPNRRPPSRPSPERRIPRTRSRLARPRQGPDATSAVAPSPSGTVILF